MEAFYGIGITGMALRLVVMLIKGIFLYGDYIAVCLMGMELSSITIGKTMPGIILLPIYVVAMFMLDKKNPKISNIIGIIMSTMSCFVIFNWAVFKNGIVSNNFLDVVLKIVLSATVGFIINLIKKNKRKELAN